MSNVIIILIILFVTIGMVGFGLVLNQILGLKKGEMKKIRERALNLQERMRNAKVLGDLQLMMQIQRETVKEVKNCRTGTKPRYPPGKRRPAPNSIPRSPP